MKDLDNYVPERTREIKDIEMLGQSLPNFTKQQHYEQKNHYQKWFDLQKRLHTPSQSEPYGDLNRLADAMNIYHIAKEAEEGCPEEYKPLLTTEQQAVLSEVEYDIETYLDNYKLTWRNKYWDKREFLRKLSS